VIEVAFLRLRAGGFHDKIIAIPGEFQIKFKVLKIQPYFFVISVDAMLAGFTYAFIAVIIHAFFA